MASTPTVINTSKPGGTKEFLPVAVQGSRDTVTITWLYSSGAAVNIAGGTISAVYAPVEDDDNTVYAVDGVLAVTDGANGIFTWAYGAGDVGTAGSYLVQFKAVLPTVIYSSQVGWAVEETLGVGVVAAGVLVGVSVAESAWLTAAEGSGVAGADIVGTSDTQALTNKTLDYDLNTITNLPAAGIHASDHVDGTDDIQDATAAQKGLATAAQITKLDGVEALADVTDAANVNAAGATMNTDSDVKANTWTIDENNMVSDLDTKVPTQQSVKAYADLMLPLAGGTMAGAIAMADNNINRVVLKDYGEEPSTSANTGATDTIDMEDGNFHPRVLTDNCTFTFSNPSASGTICSFTLELTQDGTGSRLVTWPGSVDWPAATAPTLSTGVGDIDVFTFYTRDAGTKWMGFTAGLDMS